MDTAADPNSQSARRLARWIPWIAFGFVAWVSAGLLFVLYLRSPGVPAEKPAISEPIGEFSFYRESDTLFREIDLDHKTTVINFFFTRCPGPCPLMTAQLREIERAFGSSPSFQIASITLDPSNDTSAALRAYADRYGIKPANWAFLRAPLDQTIAFAQQALRVPAGEDPDLHTTRFILVDRQRRVRGVFDSTSPRELEALRAQLKNFL